MEGTPLPKGHWINPYGVNWHCDKCDMNRVGNQIIVRTVEQKWQKVRDNE